MFGISFEFHFVVDIIRNPKISDDKKRAKLQYIIELEVGMDNIMLMKPFETF